MAFSTEQRADQVAQANAEKNRNKEEAKEILSTEAGVLQMASLAEEGGSMGRRIARELRQFEATGRVSNWLAGETIKAESKKDVPSYVVDDFVKRGVLPATFQSPQTLPFGGLPQFAPTIPSEGGGAAPSPAHPWKITLQTSEDDEVVFFIESESKIYSSLEDWNSISISGLGDPLAVSEGFIYLLGTVSGGEASEASIEIGEPSERIEFNGDEQVGFATIIGYIYAEEESWRVRQDAFHNFTLMQICVDGKAAIYPFAT